MKLIANPRLVKISKTNQVLLFEEKSSSIFLILITAVRAIAVAIRIIVLKTSKSPEIIRPNSAILKKYFIGT